MGGFFYANKRYVSSCLRITHHQSPGDKLPDILYKIQITQIKKDHPPQEDSLSIIYLYMLLQQ